MTRHVALVLSDIVDSTALNAAIGDGAMSRLWAVHDQQSRAMIRQWRGVELRRSDGFLAGFDDVGDAASFALAYHRALDALEHRMRARIGIHVGDVEWRLNSADDVAGGATAIDIDGMTLPIVARICAIAGPRQTLLSRSAYLHVAQPMHHVSHGHWQLKGVGEPVEIYEIGDERTAFTPPADGEKAYRVVADGPTWKPRRDIRHSLPAARDEFVGRDSDLLRIATKAAAGARLITVVGFGGVGKTRLAIQFATRWLGDFTGGAWFCDLTQARDLAGIVSAMAQGFDLALRRGEPRRQVADVLLGRGKCLVLLDNFEQVVHLAEDTVGYWLARAPDTTFLVTSRERLSLPGEHVVGLEPMTAEDAFALFLCRSRGVHLPSGLGQHDYPAIRDLVACLDGLPLAVELAVGRLPVMSPRSMLDRIQERFKLLATRGGRPRRQSTLRAAFDWSWDLLSARERSLLAEAAVFSGEFTLEAAERVLRGDDSEEDDDVLDTIQSLVEKSFVRVVAHERFSLLASVREYALEKLDAPDRVRNGTRSRSAVERRHGEYFAQPLGADASARASDLDNIVAACRAAVARHDRAIILAAATNAWKILEARGPIRLAMELAESALAVPALDGDARANLCYVLGRCQLVSGDLTRARTQLTDAHGEAVRAGSRIVAVRCLSSLAELNLVTGNVDEARVQQEQAVVGARELGDPVVACSTLNGMGLYCNRVARFDEARMHFEEALTVARQTGNRRWEGGVLSNLGNVEANLGERALAKAHYDAAIVIARSLADRVWEGDLLCNLGLFKLDEHDLPGARADLDASLAIARENGLSLLESVALCNLGLLYEATGDGPAAEAAYRDALAVARRRGDRRSEGQFLGYLGLLVARRGSAEEARASLLQSIAALREVKDRMSLAIALCRHAEACVIWGECERAAGSIEEAAAIASDIDVKPGSELADALARARHAAGLSPSASAGSWAAS